MFRSPICASIPAVVLSTSTRILELLALLSLQQEWTGAELADRLGVSLRTVRRDIDRLRALGYPVDSSRGVAGGYRLRAGADLPPLLLDDDEAITVAVALRTAASGGVLGLEEPAMVALGKLERVLPSRLRRRIAALSAATTSIAPASADAVDAGLLVTLADAVRDRTGLRLAYRDSRGDRSLRRVEPYRLVHTGRRWYLVAYDLDRDAWRTLRIDRIERQPTIDRRFHARTPPADDLRAYVAGQISHAPYAHRVQLRVAAPAHEIAQRMSPTAASVTAVDADSCIVQTGADDLAVLCAWLGALDAPFHLEQATPGVRPQLARTAARLNAAATSQREARRSE